MIFLQVDNSVECVGCKKRNVSSFSDLVDVLSVCMYVCMYVYMYVYFLSVCYVCIHVCVFLLGMYVCINICMFLVGMYVCIHLCIYVKSYAWAASDLSGRCLVGIYVHMNNTHIHTQNEQFGQKNKKMRETKYNEKSSRSHTILQVYLYMYARIMLMHVCKNMCKYAFMYDYAAIMYACMYDYAFMYDHAFMYVRLCIHV